mgnify:CR=1 FL=1
MKVKTVVRPKRVVKTSSPIRIKSRGAQQGERNSGSNRTIVTCGALFSGIGGFCAGFEDVGFGTSWAVDLAPEATKTYTSNYPDTPVFSRDIKTLSAGDLSPVDVLHAGFPCQSFSGAGDRLGFDDHRGKLFFDVIRLIKEWGKNKPKVLVLENSPYLMIGDDGRWFDVIKSEIQSAGYWFSSKHCYVLDTYEHAGIPQQRKRLFMVAVCRDKFDHNGVAILPKEVPQKVDLLELLDLNSEIDEQYFLPVQNRYNELITRYVTPEFPSRIYQLRKYIVRAKSPGICPTLTANMGGGGHNVPFIFDRGRLRKLTERECLRLQGFSEKFDFPEGMIMSQRYRLIGNAVSPPVARIVAEAVYRFIKEAE